jgi:hypothetical protein
MQAQMAVNAAWEMRISPGCKWFFPYDEIPGIHATKKYGERLQALYKYIAILIAPDVSCHPIFHGRSQFS